MPTADAKQTAPSSHNARELRESQSRNWSMGETKVDVVRGMLLPPRRQRLAEILRLGTVAIISPLRFESMASAGTRSRTISASQQHVLLVSLPALSRPSKKNAESETMSFQGSVGSEGGDGDDGQSAETRQKVSAASSSDRRAGA